MKKLSERKKEILILLGITILSALPSYFLSKIEEPPGFVKYLWCVGLVIVCFFGFLESREHDEFVNNTTQRMGVSNSYTVSIYLLSFNFHWFKGWFISAVILCICLFCSHELGRQSYKKHINKYINQKGILLTDLPNKAKAEINGEKITVWSKGMIKAGTPVYVSEIKGRYIYVSNVKN